MKDVKGIQENGRKEIKVLRICSDVPPTCLNGAMLNKSADFTSFKHAGAVDKISVKLDIVSTALDDVRKGVGRDMYVTMRPCCIWMHDPGIRLGRRTQ
jgi:hypothetical protein